MLWNCLEKCIVKEQCTGEFLVTLSTVWGRLSNSKNPGKGTVCVSTPKPVGKKKKKKGFYGGKRILNYPTQDNFPNPAHLSYFFDPLLLWAKWMLQAGTVLMVSFPRLFPLLPSPKAELPRLQEPLHAITSQAARWQLRQGLMQGDIIECGLQQSSCLEPLLIVAVIRWSLLPKNTVRRNAALARSSALMAYLLLPLQQVCG